MLNWLSRKLYKAQSAEQLMLKFAQYGKPELLDELVARHGDDLYHYLLSLTDSTLAADLAQMAWLKVIEKRESFNRNKAIEQANFKAWLFTLARNLMIDHYRSQKSFEPHDWDQQTTQPLSEQVIAQQSLEQFNQLLAQLPKSQQEAFMLQQEGFSLEQIAEITAENRETIKSRLRYARDHFKPLTQQIKEDA